MSYRRAKNLDKDLKFAEYFNSEQEVRRNGGVPTDVTFSNGVASFGPGDVSYPNLSSGIYSVRVKFKTGTTVGNSVLVDFRGSATGTGYVNIVSSEFDSSSGTIYLNGSLGAGIALSPNTEYEGIITGLTAVTTADLHVGSNYVSPLFDGSIELVEIYNKALTAEEVSNLYNDARYVMPNLEKKQQLSGEFITGGDMTNASDWDINPLWDVADGFATFTDDVSTSILDQACESFKAGDWFEFVFTTNCPAGNSRFSLLGTGGIQWLVDGVTGYNNYADGTHTVRAQVNIDGARIGLSGSPSASGDFTVTNFSGKKVTIEETKTILNVNAFSGVARNVLSGDVLSNIVNDATFDIADYSLYDATSPSARRFVQTGYSSGVSMVVCTIGKRYGVQVNATLSNSNLFRLKDGGVVLFSETVSGAADTGYITFVATSTTFQIEALNNSGTTVDIDFVQINEIIPETVNTAIEVVKAGMGVRMPRFGSVYNSRIDCGDYHDLTGDITALAWVKANTHGAGSSGRIIDNDKFKIFLNGLTVAQIRVQSDASTTKGADSLLYKEYSLIAVTRKADGTTQIYLDGTTLGTAGSSGTPVAGTSNLFIGNRLSSTGNHDGEIPEVQVLEGLLTSEEISQYYTATKHLYNK